MRFAQSNNQTSRSDSLILRVRTDSGMLGYGEACPRQYVSGESVAVVARNLQEFWKRRGNLSIHSLTDIQAILEEVPTHWGPACVCALELALLDAWGKEQSSSVHQLLGTSLSSDLQYSGVCPIADEGKTAALLQRLHRIGFQEVKLKLGRNLEESLFRIQMVKEIMGAETLIRADLNCAWSFKDAQKQLPHLIQAGVSNAEQIFLPEQTAAYQLITKEFGHAIRITIDEGVTTPESAFEVMKSGIGNQLNLKVSKHGGILATLKICELAKEHGYGLQLGAHFGETSLLTAAGMIVASLRPELSSLEGAFGQHLLEKDICERPLQFGPSGRLWLTSEQQQTPGLGVEVQPDLLQTYSLSFSAQAA